MSTNQMVAEFI